MSLLQVLHCPPYSSVEGSGVRGALEGQPKFLVVNLPVMKDRVDFIILQIPVYVTIQDDRFVSESLSADEEVGLSVGSVYSVDGDGAETSAGQRKPAAAGVVSGHNHSSYTCITLIAVWI